MTSQLVKNWICLKNVPRFQESSKYGFVSLFSNNKIAGTKFNICKICKATSIRIIPPSFDLGSLWHSFSTTDFGDTSTAQKWRCCDSTFCMYAYLWCIQCHVNRMTLDAPNQNNPLALPFVGCRHQTLPKLWGFPQQNELCSFFLRLCSDFSVAPEKQTLLWPSWRTRRRPCSPWHRWVRRPSGPTRAACSSGRPRRSAPRQSERAAKSRGPRLSPPTCTWRAIPRMISKKKGGERWKVALRETL